MMMNMRKVTIIPSVLARAVKARCLAGTQQQQRLFLSSMDTDRWKTEDWEDFTKRGKYSIQTYNKISTKGLAKFPQEMYDVSPAEFASGPAQALLIRSHKLKEDEVDVSVRAIARCGAGTNNIPVARMTEFGIPVFNTPGANANAVKELILCGLFLGSRRITDGINHMRDLGEQGVARERVEKDKAMFGGREIKGKTMAVIGLGHIGALTARDAAGLGMVVKGYDPGLSVQSALFLPQGLELMDSITSAIADADYVSLNIPYIKGDGGTHGIIGADVVRHLKPGAVVLNFARGELVDSQAMKDHLDNSDGRYVSDFPDDELWDHKNAIIIPHLGASTSEAEDQAAAMAAETIRDFIEHGTIRNSVNFPTTELAERRDHAMRVTVVNKNVPGMVSKIATAFANAGINILQQINKSRGDIAYNVLDFDPASVSDLKVDLRDLQKELTLLDGVLSSRVLFGIPGAGYARNIDGKYHV
ncbi:D-3-phosphoglycerate dehydrogenase [Seminavis robusta]|uniref:phosphoglycerate dehydrogenase n=1 Tax=Seminavis robusta TaxID=568900 RepID=A0A9N8DPB8_9STRA|nr:D-3-phosphoglycerate dehydrogenase [Seminavis robusta]|eukprot:Sro191_g082060.1 D-3-phosphoglycerate dehydrogenase (474) ;mRNA; r:4110-5753